MPSPFPGMDPYLEQFWGDIHQRVVTYACDQLQGKLPGDLRARLQERVFVETPQESSRPMYPDVRVVQRGQKRSPAPVPDGGIAVAEPLCIRLPDEPVTQGYIEIIDVGSGRRVITVIEVVSPSNKFRGPGRALYERKQQECREGRVNLVEIDLLRSGPWVLAVPEQFVPASHRGPYRVSVYRAHDAGSVGEVYRVPLRERLPIIRIPLRPDDPDVTLDLQALIAQAYLNGGYDEDINYRAEPVPPLEDDDAVWAAALLRNKGLRPKRPPRNGTRSRKAKR